MGQCTLGKFTDDAEQEIVAGHSEGHGQAGGKGREEICEVQQKELWSLAPGKERPQPPPLAEGVFRWCPVTEKEPVGTKWNTGGSIWTSGNTSLLWGWLGAGAGCREVVQSASGKVLETCLGTALAGCSSWPCLSRGVGLWTRRTLEVPPNLSDSVIACADSTGLLLRLKSEIGAPSSGSLSIASLDVYGGRHEYCTNVHPSALLVIGTICLWL